MQLKCHFAKIFGFGARLTPQIPMSVCWHAWFGLGMNLPMSFLFCIHECSLMLISFIFLTKQPGSQKSRGPIAGVQSLYNLHSRLAWLTLPSFSRLCFWVTPLILFTNNSFCSAVRVSQRERDHYELERPHRANFTFDYGPTTGFTLNQCTV